MVHITSATGPRPVIVQAAPMRPDGAQGGYTIKPIGSRIVRIAISGFWTAPVMAGFVRELVVAVKALPCAAEEHCVVCDVSDAAIQSQAMFDAFLALLVDTRWAARRVAFISISPISRIQARRMMAARDGLALFDDEPAALRWLMEDI